LRQVFSRLRQVKMNWKPRSAISSRNRLKYWAFEYQVKGSVRKNVCSRRSKTSQFLGTRQTFLLLWTLLGYIRHVHCFGEPVAFPCRNYLGSLALFNIKTVTSKLLTASRRCCSY
jgi:hypothetical protein